MSTRFVDRSEAGRALADKLRDTRTANTVVLGLPRGGVPVASEVATALRVPLDVIVVRKVGVPGQPELAMGAIASVAGAVVTVRNDAVLRAAGPTAEGRFDEVAARERTELERREAVYREGLAPLDVRAKNVVLVDDGIATGSTMRAAISALASAEVASVTVAVPVCPMDAITEFGELADRVVCVSTPDPFWAVGQAYTDFTQTTDAEVRRLLSVGA